MTLPKRRRGPLVSHLFERGRLPTAAVTLRMVTPHSITTQVLFRRSREVALPIGSFA